MIKRMINMGSTTLKVFGIRLRPFVEVEVPSTQVGFAPLARWTLTPVKRD
jgi:hypothetical protein